MKKLLLAALFLLVGCLPTFAAVVSTSPTKAAPVKITAGLTYQSILAVNTFRNSLTIQNNNTADSCQIIIVGVGSPWLAGDTTATSRTVNGTSMTAIQASILLLPGTSYTRYYPFVPSDLILGTCTTTGDSLYVDTQ